MSVRIFIASDMPLTEFSPPQEYPVKIDVDKGVTDDGGADDIFYLKIFEDVKDYTDKNYGVYLEWDYTEGRAKQIIEYIKNALQKSDNIEFWKVWLTDYCEFEDRPFIYRKNIFVNELSTEHIKEINDSEIWNNPDKIYPERPSFYCLTITK